MSTPKWNWRDELELREAELFLPSADALKLDSVSPYDELQSAHEALKAAFNQRGLIVQELSAQLIHATAEERRYRLLVKFAASVALGMGLAQVIIWGLLR
jgi:hypothetical protein